MPLELFNTRLSYRVASRSVAIAAICNGRLIDVVVPRPVLEHLASRTRLTQQECLAAVSDNLETLRRAAAFAAARSGIHVAVTVIELGDLASTVALDGADAVS